MTCKQRTLALLLILALLPTTLPATTSVAAKRLPNFVLIFVDDLGYADLGSFGAQGYATPNLDRMAREGVRLTDFYVAQAVCTASRAALLTGCYSNRIGLTGALFPNSRVGINEQELTIAEVLKTRGYATAIFGKWHLGDAPQFLPTRHGFDEYLGLPYSNDMWPENPAKTVEFPPLPLIEGDRTIETNPDQTQLTTRYTERAVRFIERNRERPFFLYVPHTMPHVPLYVSDKYKGKTRRGLYGDVIAELDWSVGEILAALKRTGLDDDTLVIFTSDNGPWAEYGDHAGSAGRLRGSKQTAFEGGVREPLIARWPKRIPAGRVAHQPLMTIDLLPTLAKLAGAALPPDRVIDGRDIWPVLAGKRGAGEAHDALYFYWGYELHAVRAGRWKLHLPHPMKEVFTPGNGGERGTAQIGKMELSLFDLVADPGERTNVLAQHPDVVAHLQAFAERARADLGDALLKRTGKNVRPAGRRAGAN